MARVTTRKSSGPVRSCYWRTCTRIARAECNDHMRAPDSLRQLHDSHAAILGSDYPGQFELIEQRQAALGMGSFGPHAHTDRMCARSVSPAGLHVDDDVVDR